MRVPVLLTALVCLAAITGPAIAAPLPAPVASAWHGEAETHVAEGFAHLAAGRAAAAETAFRTALALEGGWARAHAGLGLALVRRGQQPEAVGHFQTALAQPLSSELAARCYANLGMISADEGLTEDAVRHVQRALRLEPKAIYHALLARLLLGAGRLDEARTAIAAGRERDPDDPGILAMAGRIANADRRFDEAIALLTQALQRDQANHETCYELGLAQLGAGRLDAAVRWLVASVGQHAGQPRTYDTLAYVLHRQGKADAAVRALQAKLQVDPAHRTAWPDLQALEAALRAARPVP
jgi:tetratricopeptide (TPR) repeat protein